MFKASCYAKPITLVNEKLYMSPSVKQCSKCKVFKGIENFGLRSSSGDRLQCHCKPCRSNEKHKQYEASRKTRDVKSEKIRKRQSKLKCKYGISFEDYDRIFKEQGGRCAICGIIPFIRKLAVDHCHTTNKVRGLLCFNCNNGLGAMRDDQEILNAAIMYLRRTENEG